ncbi:hypothetical protein FA95DRAFT_1678333 [Auriscalpium vulgare]|uniref:Uncharacterized protein n=1 Tax=Auriscalpium vulgare TaxID=40419 RepID=A0ACB8RX40_9AGAM|nr:hypothetical protein FA95DRAFT_1678333 [Auriscalpium vulgare]
MLTSVQAPANAVILLPARRPHRLVLATRFLHASGHARYAVSASPSRAVVTKKKYADLPTTGLRSNGTPLTPLGLWDHGRKAKSSRHDAVDRSRPDHVESVSPEPPDTLAATGLSLDGSDLQATVPVTTRKKRVKKASVEIETLIEDVDEVPLWSETAAVVKDAPVKSRRRRRTKAELAAESDASRSRQPRNQLATEILENLAKFPHCILLTRVGQFYESYFDQAAEVARILNIKLTSRSWDGQRILMCGFPIMHLQKYLKTLVQHNARFVALCEEFPRPVVAGSKPTFDRRVARVITPGTLIDEPFLNRHENNYLLSIGFATTAGDPYSSSTSVGLAWIDVSTGEFFTKDSSSESLRDELVRIGPREIVLSKELENASTHPIRTAVREENTVTSYILPTGKSQAHVAESQTSNTDNVIPSAEEASLKISFSASETAAIDLLTTYLHANLLEHMPRLSLPSREGIEQRMQIDSHTIKALEIREGMREGGVTGSLLSVVKRTVTSSGTRLLARWLCSPSTSLSEINARQSLVAFFHTRPHLRSDLVELLQGIDDATRIVQKFLLGRGDAGDLSSVSGTIATWDSIRKRVELEKLMEGREKGIIVEEEWTSMDALMSRMDSLETLAQTIGKALEGVNVQGEDTEAFEAADSGSSSDAGLSSLEEPRFQTEYCWTINPDFSPELVALHAQLNELLTQRDQLERHLQRAFDAPSLTLRSSPMQGLHVHVARSKRDAARLKTSGEFVVMSESKSTSSFFHRDWSKLGKEIIQTSYDITVTEKQAFELLRNEVNMNETLLRRNARIVDELDVTLGFANLASEMKFVRPTVTDDCSFHVVNGRHPTVELGLLSNGRVFTPNTVSFSSDSRLHIITGPNMAGKSTLLRQTALVALLAQAGSYVPADHATIGIVDRLFSRVGAKDDLFRDRSTFMVEMLETAEILHRATPNSLVIMDEVGRGTTVKDGLAIAFATVHHLYATNRSRVLFATHFHELTDMLGCSADHKGQGPFEQVGFFCTDVDETHDGHFAYSYRLKPGVNRDSHGLKVAQLAGMPAAALALAEGVLSRLRDGGGAAALDRAGLQALGHSFIPDGLPPPPSAHQENPTSLSPLHVNSKSEAWYSPGASQWPLP